MTGTAGAVGHPGHPYVHPAEAVRLRTPAALQAAVLSGRAIAGRTRRAMETDSSVASDPSVECPRPGGLLGLDDSDCAGYGEARDLLRSEGFGMDFLEPRPGAGLTSTTSVSCRDSNPWLRGPVLPNGL